LPSFFNILVEEAGQPEQWVSEVAVPGGAYQGSYPYEKLPLTTSHGSAAVFSSNHLNNLISKVQVGGVPTTFYAAVGGSAIGQTIVQLYQPAYFPLNPQNYTISMTANCILSISCFGATIEKGISPHDYSRNYHFCGFHFINLFLVCAGSLAVLTGRFAQARGLQCTGVTLFVVPVIVPVSSATKSTTTVHPTSTTSTSTTTTTTTTTAVAVTSSSSAVSSAVSSVVSAASSSPVSSTTPVPSCVLPPYFTITVNETGMAPQYLYDPFSVDDEALSFTTDPSQGLIFSLNATAGQLEFTITDIYNNVVQLISEQDIQVCYH
jgi:hypothetical protein